MPKVKTMLGYVSKSCREYLERHSILTALSRESQVARILFLLFMATLLRTLGTIATYGAKVKKRGDPSSF